MMKSAREMLLPVWTTEDRSHSAASRIFQCAISKRASSSLAYVLGQVCSGKWQAVDKQIFVDPNIKSWWRNGNETAGFQPIRSHRAIKMRSVLEQQPNLPCPGKVKAIAYQSTATNVLTIPRAIHRPNRIEL